MLERTAAGDCQCAGAEFPDVNGAITRQRRVGAIHRHRAR